MRSLAITALLLTACMQQHNGADVANLECASCHMDLYNAQPDHPGQKPTTCADCHNTASWGAAHPEAAFPIATGAHAGITCNDCHEAALGSPAKGANTDCLRCHPQSQADPQHVGTPGYAYDSNTKNFCLTCHPDGKASGHPEAKFPITRGNHAGIACNDCHKSSLGTSYASNYDCWSCHTGQHRNSTHDPQLCASSGCHPSGSAGD
jgi:hypothetical protein